jgi:SAM-dependent methyltransferase
MRPVSRDVYGRPPAPDSDWGAGISRRSLLRLRLTSAARRDIDYDGLTARVRTGWERPGHEPWLRAIEPVGGTLAELVGAGPGMSLLDVGAGDGNLALACARRGADVEACDLAPAMVARGRERSADFPVRWRVADAQGLPYPDAEFDAVASSFGASLAPRASRAAGELVRVARPGGIVAMTAWSPRGLPGALDALVEPLAPLPDGVDPPAEWGVQDVMRRRLSSLLEDLELRTRTVTLSFPSADALFGVLTLPLPLDAAGRDELRPAFDGVLASCNNSPPAVTIDARYLIAIGRRPG